MKILVTPDKMKIIQKGYFNANEYKVEPLIFTYSGFGDLIEDMQRKVIITTPSGAKYFVNEFQQQEDEEYFTIPKEALEEVGTIEIGMTLEEWYNPIRGEGERVLVSRFSPSPVYARVHKGSYKEV